MPRRKSLSARVLGPLFALLEGGRACVLAESGRVEGLALKFASCTQMSFLLPSLCHFFSSVQSLFLFLLSVNSSHQFSPCSPSFSLSVLISSILVLLPSLCLSLSLPLPLSLSLSHPVSPSFFSVAFSLFFSASRDLLTCKCKRETYPMRWTSGTCTICTHARTHTCMSVAYPMRWASCMCTTRIPRDGPVWRRLLPVLALSCLHPRSSSQRSSSLYPPLLSCGG